MAEVTVADPAAEAGRLAERLSEWSVQQNGRGGTVELQIFVPAEDFREAVARADSGLAAYGFRLAVQEKDVASQLAETEERITELEAARDALSARLEGEADQDRLEEGLQELAKIRQQLDTERTNYENLREAVENSVIVLTIKPGPTE